MENNYSSYNENLKQLLKFNYTVVIIITIVILGVTLYLLKLKCKKEAFIGLCGCLIIVAIILISSILPYHRDIKENAYFVYEGEFYVEECYYSNRSATYILIKTNDSEHSKRYKIICNTSCINNDTYYMGSFVCAKHSNTIVDIKLE